jgi:hypothetical protein
VQNIICPVSEGSLDSLDTLYEPAAGPDGQLLYLREATPPGAITAINSALVLAQEAAPLAAVTIRPYPYTAQNGKIHQGISHIRWLSATRALYLAEKILYISECSACPLDTVRTGIEIVQVDLSGATATTTIIPNTDEASSIATGANGDQVFFTRNGDSRVYQLTLSNGDLSVVHDFGPGVIARDVSIVGNRLFAVTGGRVSFVVDSTLGSLQKDAGGTLQMVDLGSGNSSPLIVLERFFRRPAASPRGDRMVAEAFQAIITNCGVICRDTSISKVADLWLFEIP